MGTQRCCRCTAWCRCVDIHNVWFPCPAGEGWAPQRNWQGPQELLWELAPEAVGDRARPGSQQVPVSSAAFPCTKVRASALSQYTDQGLGARGADGWFPVHGDSMEGPLGSGFCKGPPLHARRGRL